MTDNQGWQPPASNSPDAVSPWAMPGNAAAPAQPVPAWQQQQQQGWTPPPKPGLIPLRPMSFGTILGTSFRIMRRNPAPTFGLSMLLYGVIIVVFAVVYGLLFALMFSRLSSADYDDQGDIAAGSFGLFALGSLIPVALSIVATGVAQGIISLEVARATLGEKLKLRGLWRLAKGRLGTLVLWTLLLGAVLTVYILIWALVIFGSFAALTSGSQGADAIAPFLIGVFASIVLWLAFAVVAAWLGTKLALVPSIILLERLTLRESIKRSWSLMRGSFWRTLGIQLLIGVIINAASSVVSTPLGFIAGMAMTLINPNGDSTAGIVLVVVVYLVSGVIGIVVGAIGLVLMSGSLALIYIDIRMRKEGLDLELMHYVEAKQAGTPGVENPYERLQSTSAPSSPGAAGSPWA